MNPIDYPLAEILMFSAETYYRMIELYNRSIWPVHFLALLLGSGTILICFYKTQYQGRIVAATIMAGWLWVSYGFFWTHYATINWYAIAYAAVYMVQVLALIWAGLFQNRIRTAVTNDISSVIGVFLLVYAIALHPILTGSLNGLWHTEVFGLMPVPTVIATLGIISLSEKTPSGMLTVIPVIAAIVGGATAWELGTYEALSALIAAILTIISIITRGWTRKATELG